MGIAIRCEYRFEAAHWLPWVADDHKCRRMHGHNYLVALSYRGKGPHNGLDDRGMVKDFAEVDEVALPLVRLIDHTVLNETCIANPTAELLAIWFAAGTGADRVEVYETVDKCAIWER